MLLDPEVVVESRWLVVANRLVAVAADGVDIAVGVVAAVDQNDLDAEPIVRWTRSDPVERADGIEWDVLGPNQCQTMVSSFH